MKKKKDEKIYEYKVKDPNMMIKPVDGLIIQMGKRKVVQLKVKKKNA